MEKENEIQTANEVKVCVLHFTFVKYVFIKSANSSDS